MTMKNLSTLSRPSIGLEQQTGSEVDQALMQDMDSVFSGEESTVIAAFQVGIDACRGDACMHGGLLLHAKPCAHATAQTMTIPEVSS